MDRDDSVDPSNWEEYLQMPSLKERGLFAYPTKGDGKESIQFDLHSLLRSRTSCSAPI
jgi:hypothetical protein